MDEKQQALMEMMQSGAFQELAAKELMEKAKIISEQVEGKEEWIHTIVPLPVVKGQEQEAKDPDAPVTWTVGEVTIKTEPVLDLLHNEELAERAKEMEAAIQKDLTRAMIEGQSPKVIEVEARDPEPKPLDPPARKRCDAQQAKARKVTNREKRRQRHAKTQSRRR